MKKPTVLIEAEWEIYAQKAVADDLYPEEVADLKSAFYAGVVYTRGMFRAFANMDKEAQNLYMEAVDKEIDNHIIDMEVDYNINLRPLFEGAVDARFGK